jgi:parvulin-like peptidyl-prolyl isomerase
LSFPGGYEILLLTDTQEAIVTPFPEARDAVVRILAQQGQAKERANYVKSLAKRYGVSIELDELKGAYPGGVFP